MIKRQREWKCYKFGARFTKYKAKVNLILWSPIFSILRLKSKFKVFEFSSQFSFNIRRLIGNPGVYNWDYLTFQLAFDLI